MTKQIKSAIEELESRISPYNCCQADYLANKAINTAIRSLKAWEEVLQEVERQQKNGYWAIRLDVLTEFINQKLSEIEE